MTTTTLTLAEFLLARITEEEIETRAADRARSGSWEAYNGDGWWVEARAGIDTNEANIVCDGIGEDDNFNAEVTAKHIARFDPVRVLAECETKRRVVERFIETARPYDSADQQVEHEQMEFYVLPALAQPYADHPDFCEEWTP